MGDFATGHGGLSIVGTHSMDAILNYGYADICRWGGSSSLFSLFLWNETCEETMELKVSSAQASDMAGVILDYINVIMAASGDDDA